MTAHIQAHPLPHLANYWCKWSHLVCIPGDNPDFFLRWVGNRSLAWHLTKVIWYPETRGVWPELVGFWSLHLLEREIWTGVTAESWADMSASRDTKNRKKRMNARLEDRTNPKITKKIRPASRPTPKTNRRDKDNHCKKECVMERKREARQVSDLKPDI